VIAELRCRANPSEFIFKGKTLREGMLSDRVILVVLRFKGCVGANKSGEVGMELEA
jgi:hypothetical protein